MRRLAKISKVSKWGDLKNWEAGKNAAFRNFIEIMSSSDLVEILT